MVNQLANENSPYLLQHKNNPVEWYPWGSEALEKAKAQDKPIFLSIGYAACHWCHVMEHESFEDPETANLMNEHFVNIKVDREERPDLDGIYMSAVVAMTGQGGWPMSVFLTPSGEPFYGGTYFPPVRRYNMPAFREVLQGIAAAWVEDRAGILENSQKLSAHIKNSNLAEGNTGPATRETLDQAVTKLDQNYDWGKGGWGQAPKFPQAMSIRFLLQRGAAGDQLAVDMASHALEAMARGGMYDVVGGGFARYSVDNEWLVPHFEKMLYDNALLARAYLLAYLVTGNTYFREICEQTLDFVLRELTHKEGGFFSSLDADSEGEEGKFYVWTLEEISTILDNNEDARLFSSAYGLTKEGNFEGKTILQRVVTDSDLANEFGISKQEAHDWLDKLHKKLYQARSKRVWPGTDDKVLTSWNAWMLTALAEAGRYLERSDYLEAAQRNAEFLLRALHPKDRLLRSWREEIPRHNGYLEDYASVILGLLALYQSDPQPRWYESARRLTDDMVLHFQDPDGGFFDTRQDHEELLLRPKELQDNATPSGNSLAAEALLQMAAFSGRGEWHDMAMGQINKIHTALETYPTAFANWLCAATFGLGPIQEIAILGDPQSKELQALVRKVWEKYRPTTIAAIAPAPPPDGAAPLLADRPLIGGKPTVYVCQNFVCQQPVFTEDDLEKQLR